MNLYNHLKRNCTKCLRSNLTVGIFYQNLDRLPSLRLSNEPLPNVRQMQLEAPVTRPEVSIRTPLRPTQHLMHAGKPELVFTKSPRDRHKVPAGTNYTQYAYFSPMSTDHPSVRHKVGMLCTGSRCGADRQRMLDLVALAYTHRQVWMRISTDRSLDDDDYVVVLDGASLPPLPSYDGSWLDVASSAATQSQAAGIFWLSDCGETLCSTITTCSEGSIVPCQHCVSDCLRAYGIFKWRAAWLWDSVRAALHHNTTFHGNNTNSLSLGAHIREGLKLILPAAQWPVLISLFN